jgi:hypothetical protein
MTRCNDLAEQMGVGAEDDDRHDVREFDERKLALLDEYIEQCNLAYDAWLHARDETAAAEEVG